MTRHGLSGILEGPHPLDSFPPVYSFRTFRNSDPPHLASIWRSQPPQRGLIQPITTALLEQAVFSKQYFDPAGLIVACKDDQPVGFVHAAFGVDENEDRLSTDVGSTQLLMVRKEERESQLAIDLLAHSEDSLRSRGAGVLYAGGIKPINGFYLGLYGGSELPGILATDPMERIVRTRGYREIDRVLILQRNLNGYRPAFSREARQFRREFTFSESYCPAPRSWWESSLFGDCERIEYSIHHRRDNVTVASVWFWDIQPLATSWGTRAVGMYDLFVEPEYRRRGVATHLLLEAFKSLTTRRICLVEAQTMYQHHPALSLYGNLEFQTVDCGYVFRKEST